jgi:endonuclease/exonuclease/phosphatase family metal-dependent hydrolase
MADAALLRVVTLNVLGPANPDWQRRSRLIAATLAELAPDIVALHSAGAVFSAVADRIANGAEHRHREGISVGFARLAMAVSSSQPDWLRRSP